jgi:AcrR family transcriptional regulator
MLLDKVRASSGWYPRWVAVESGRTLRRDARLNREHLIAAAQEVFAEQGLGSSLEEVARRAGVSIGTLYNHFGSRTGLVDAALLERVESSIGAAEQGLRNPDAWAGLVEHLTAIARLQAMDRGYAEICVVSLPAGSATERAKARGHRLFRQLVDRAHRAGTLRADVDLADLGLLTWGVVRATEGIRAVAPEAWERHLAILLDGMRSEAAHPLPGEAIDPALVHDAMALGR